MVRFGMKIETNMSIAPNLDSKHCGYGEDTLSM